MTILISSFTAVIPINYSSEFQEGFEANMQINFTVSICSVWIRLFWLPYSIDINPCEYITRGFVKDIKRGNIQNMGQLKGDISIAPKIFVLMFWKLMTLCVKEGRGHVEHVLK
jgi:hypothetical protein